MKAIRPTIYSFQRHFLLFCCVVVGVSLLYVSIFSEVFQRSPEKTVWIIDTSLSMIVRDVTTSQPGREISRLDLAKALTLSGIENIPGEHAVISYARDPVVQSPFLADPLFVQNIVKNLDTVGLFGGSDLPGALSLIKALYGRGDDPLRVIILTDGGNTSDAQLEELPENFRLYIFGIGTLSGDKIPIGYDQYGAIRYKYHSGQVVVSRYDPERIASLTDAYNAQLYHMTEEALFPWQEIAPLPDPHTKQYLIFLGSICVILGYGFFPFVHKKS